MRVQLNPAARAAPETIGQLTVRSDQGAAVPLDNIADISVAGGPAQIDRYDRDRIVTLSRALEGRPVSEVLKEARAIPSLNTLPPDVNLVLSSDIAYTPEIVTSFVLATRGVLYCVYAEMVRL